MTATAYCTRPMVLKPEEVTLELILALPEDLKEFDSWAILADGARERKMRLRTGVIFWLRSMVTLQIGSTPYILNDRTDLNELAEWLKNDMVYIAKNPFNN